MSNMRDICTESLIPIVPKSRDKLLKFMLIGILIASLALVILVGVTGFLVTAVCAFLLYHHLPKTNGEYEYVHTNDVFDVDMVICNNSRKHLCSANLDHVSLVAPADSDEVHAFGNIRETDYSGNSTQGKLYAMIYTKDGVPQKLLLRMDEKMRKSLKQWIPGKVR